MSINLKSEQLRVLLAFGAICLYFVISKGSTIPTWKVFFWLSSTLVFYNLIELFFFLKKNSFDRASILAPVFLTSSIVFCIGYGFSNILFLENWFDIDSLGVGNGAKVTSYIIEGQVLAIIASLGLWIGHYSATGKYFLSSNFTKKIDWVLPNSITVKNSSLLLILLISIGARFLQENLGLFGYCSSYDSIIVLRKYTYLLTLLANLGKFGLIFSLIFFCGKKSFSKIDVFWVFVFWLSETFFGIMSGFKSPIIMPTVYVGLAALIGTKSTKPMVFAIWLSLVFLLYLGSISFVETYRQNVNARSDRVISCSSLNQSLIVASTVNNALLNQTSVDGISTSWRPIGKPISVEVSSDRDSVSYKVGMFLARMNFSHIGSYGIAYVDTGPGKLPNNLVMDIVLSPFHAWIPRAIWSSKPISNLGHFYNQVVIGVDTNSSTAMGPVTYAYMAGGVVAVFLIFYIIGATQNAFYGFLLVKNKLVGQTIFLMLLGSFSTLESVLSTYFVDIFRLIPIYILVFYLLFLKNWSWNARV